MKRLYEAILALLILFSMQLSYATNNERLFAAIESDNIEEMINLIKHHGASIEARNTEDDTPLIYAVIEGNVPAVKILLQHGANVNAQDEDGNSPLHMAASYGEQNSQALTDLLLQYGANTEIKNDNGDTPLILAALHNNLPLVQTLLDHGADIHATNNENKSPFNYANDEIKTLLNSYANAPSTKGAIIDY